MNTLNTIIEEEKVDRYSVETGLLKRFFKLYEEGRKTGDPQNYIDYFKAEHYLLTEVGKAITSRDTYWKERVRKWVDENEYCSKCCSPKEYCMEWGEHASAIDTNDLLQALDNLK